MEHSARSPSGGSVAGRDDLWFEDLFTRFHGPVRAYALRRAAHEADDIVAEVFAVAWRKRESVPDNALPWLYAVAAREMLHAFRVTVLRLSLSPGESSRLTYRGRTPLACVRE